MPSLFGSLIDSPATRAIVMRKGVGHPVVHRFVAGDQLSDALQSMKMFQDEGMNSTVMFLPMEDGKTIPEQVSLQYQDCIRGVATFYPDAHVSVKPSALGLFKNKETALRNLQAVIERSKERGSIFITVETEQGTQLDPILALIREARTPEVPMGIILQSKLRRTTDDIKKLLPENIPIFLERGTGQGNPVVALTDPAAIDRQYREHAATLFEHVAAKKVPHAIVSEDDKAIGEFKLIARKAGLPQDKVNFHMAMGVNPELQNQLKTGGYSLRITIPYGDNWYEYFATKMRQNPAAGSLLVKALLKS